MPYGYHILLVDDDETSREVLAEYIRLSGLMASTVENGLQALEFLSSQGADVVLLDIQMPQMDGFQTLSAMRSDHRLENTPVIFLSSFDRPNLKVKGLELGADDYVVKPVNRAELVARVKVALRRSERFRSISRSLGGSLSDVPIPVLLQTLALSNRTATVELFKGAGQIYLNDGMFTGAEWMQFRDEDALLRLCLIPEGTFETQFDRHPDLACTPRQLENILLSMVTVLDETFAVLGTMKEPGASVVLDTLLPEDHLLAKILRPRLRFSVREILTTCEYPIIDTANALQQACQSGYLRQA